MTKKNNKQQNRKINKLVVDRKTILNQIYGKHT